jgi:hypothetical protein
VAHAREQEARDRVLRAGSAMRGQQAIWIRHIRRLCGGAVTSSAMMAINWPSSWDAMASSAPWAAWGWATLRRRRVTGSTLHGGAAPLGALAGARGRGCSVHDRSLGA